MARRITSKTLRRNSCSFQVESLEPRRLLAAAPVISEFLAVNNSGLQDEDGETSDWIEVFNAGDEAVDLFGYSLTDDADDLTKWRMPHVNLNPGERLVVFASNKDREDPEGELHTNFRLSGNGEYLALVAPDANTIIQEFGPEYPAQVADIAYGLSHAVQEVDLLSDGASGKYFVPTDNTLQDSWFTTDFSDVAWTDGTLPLGFDSNEIEPLNYADKILAHDPIGYWRFEETGGRVARDSSESALDADYVSTPTRTLDGPDSSVNAALTQPNSATGFDGRREAVTTTASILSGLGSFSMMGFIHPDEFTDNRIGLFGQNDAIEFGFINPNTLQIWTPNGGSLNVDYTLPRNEWHHVAVVGTGTELRMYIDGQLAGTGGSATGSYGSSGSNFNIGGGGIFDNSGNNYKGGMDEVAVFDVALNQEDISQILDPNFGLALHYDDIIATDVQAAMKGNSSSLYARIPFNLDDPDRVVEMTMGIQYDDGFVAYLNGSEIARSNVLGDDDVTLPYDVTATQSRADDAAIQFEQFDLTDARDSLLPGENILAIQGINVTADNTDFLLSTTLSGFLSDVDSEQIGYLLTPTPNDENPSSASGLGPLVDNVNHLPLQPAASDPIVVTAEVAPTLRAVANVELLYRVMFGADTTLSMNDDGSGNDATANDGIYTATIPANISQPGDMVRWKVQATDVRDEVGRAPTFEFNTGNNQSAEYFGTMMQDAQQNSGLPIINWFVEDERAAGTDSGTRASLYYNGEFYDNMYVRARGGSTQGLPKTNFKFDFKGDTFRFDPEHPRVEEFNLNSNYSDKATVRQAMAFEAYAQMGSPASISFPMHVRRNGEFYGLFVFIEEPDEEMLDRNGLDRDGALYKFYNEFTSPSGARKKTRTYEGNSDLAEFVRNVNRLRGEELTNYLFDNVDIPTVLNYLVATVLIHQNDNPHKNHYLFRDSNISGEWMFMPWDNDLTWGSNWVGTSTSDVIYADVDRITFGPVPSHDLSVIQPSHPFVNTEPHREWNNHWNRLMDAVLNVPEIKEMYLRRLRTGMDKFLGEPGTTDSFYDRRFLEYLEQTGTDAIADLDLWPRTYGDRDQTMAEAVEIIRTEYLEVRRQHLYVTHSVDSLGMGETVTLLPEFSDATFTVPINNDLGTTWTEIGFDDATWNNGKTGVGFESRGNFVGLINSVIKPTDFDPGATSIFVRAPFHVDDPSTVEHLTLQMKYDDAFVASINGTEIRRQNVRNPDDPVGWDSRGRGRPRQSAQKYENFRITLSEFPNLLKPGENILAIHGLNSSASNNDMLILPVLLDGIIPDSIVAGIPHAQVGNPEIKFDPADFDAHPVSGNQDEEYLRLNNPTDQAVDISGWKLDGGVEHTFKEGTVISAGGSLFVSPQVMAFRAREVGPSGNQGLFVQGNYNGHLSRLGETVNLLAGDGTLMDSLTIPEDPSEVQQFLRVTEVHYNPAGFADDTEFIELANISVTTTLNLSGSQVTNGPGVPFVFADGTDLAPGGRLLIVNNQVEFQNAYPNVSANLIVGEFEGGLANNGERIKVDDAEGNTVVDFTFGDSDPWPASPDNHGATLELMDHLTPTNQLDKWYSWQGSSQLGGTPGADSSAATAIVINEVIANSALTLDAIELHNPTEQEVDISGWFLSDDSDNFQKFEIPGGTSLAAGGYIVFDESNFNPTPNNPAENHFALSSQGDDLYLTIGDGNGATTTMVDDVHFRETRMDESMARFAQGGDRLLPSASPTLGAANGEARVSSLVISEVHYNPGQPSAAALAIYPELNGGDLEFVELTNQGDATLDLTGWKLRGGIDMNFDVSTMVPANEQLVIVSFNPANPDNADRVDAFRTQYGIDESVALVGGFGNQLGNSFDQIRLESPGVLIPGDPNIPDYFEDGVLYDDLRPWPESADGNGHSLNRNDLGRLGFNAANWNGADPTPGTHVSLDADFNDDGIVDHRDIDALCVGTRSANPDLQFDLNGDGSVNVADQRVLVFDILGTTYGDSNLDGRFDSRDLVLVFQAGQYEDGILLNSGWRHGDWNCDGEFTTNDLVVAFQEGDYKTDAIAIKNTKSTEAGAAILVGDAVQRNESNNAVDRLGIHEDSTKNRGAELPEDTVDLIFAEMEDANDKHVDSEDQPESEFEAIGTL